MAFPKLCPFSNFQIYKLVSSENSKTHVFSHQITTFKQIVGNEIKNCKMITNLQNESEECVKKLIQKP